MSASLNLQGQWLHYAFYFLYLKLHADQELRWLASIDFLAVARPRSPHRDRETLQAWAKLGQGSAD